MCYGRLSLTLHKDILLNLPLTSQTHSAIKRNFNILLYKRLNISRYYDSELDLCDEEACRIINCNEKKKQIIYTNKFKQMS